MQDKVRIGVIGVGIIGKHHLANYQKIAGAEIVAICDIDEPELQRVSEAYGIEDTCVDFRDLLRRDDIDAVDVCLHNNLHMPVTIEALRAGKHVYCEKPMAGSYCDAETMLQVAQAEGRKLSIQLATLYSKETKAARTLIDEGMLGHIYHARSNGFRRSRPALRGWLRQDAVRAETDRGGWRHVRHGRLPHLESPLSAGQPGGRAHLW